MEREGDKEWGLREKEMKNRVAERRRRRIGLEREKGMKNRVGERRG